MISAASTTTDSCSTTVDPTTCSKSAARLSIPPRSSSALREIDGVDHAFVTNLPGAQGDRVGAAVVCDAAATTVDHLRRSARELLSSFKVPTVWLLVDSDDTIPRGPTGKVDVRRLRDMLTAADSQASDRQQKRETGQRRAHGTTTQKQHQDADPSGSVRDPAIARRVTAPGRAKHTPRTSSRCR